MRIVNGNVFKLLLRPLGFKRRKKTALPSGAPAETSPELQSLPLSSARIAKLPPELLLQLCLYLDVHSLVLLAQCSNWLTFKMSPYWAIRYHLEFPFDQGDKELDWLWHFREGCRQPSSSVTMIHTEARLLRVKKERRILRRHADINWFRAYCCRRQTEFNLSRFIPFRRIVSLPPEYHQENWRLVAANQLCFVFWSDESRSLLAYHPSGSIKRKRSPSKTSNLSETNHFFRLDRGNRQSGRYVCWADGDIVLARINEYVDWPIKDTTSLIWLANRRRALEVHWPYSSDVDSRASHEWNVKSIRQGWVLALTRTPNEDRLCIYHIVRGRWCGGTVTSRHCHFQMTTESFARVFCFSEDYVKDRWQPVWRLWEFRPDEASERCVKHGTFSLESTEPLKSRSFRLGDTRAAVVQWRAENGDTSKTVPALYFHQINFSNSNSLEWQMEIPGDIDGVKLLPNRHELFVTTKNRSGYMLNMSTGTILREVSRSINHYDVWHVIGSVCVYRKRDGTGQHLMDTWTGNDIDLSDRGVHFSGTSSLYGCLCAEKNIRRGTLTILNWLDQ